MKKLVLYGIAILMAITLVISCDDAKAVKTYTVTFKSDGGSEIAPVDVIEGEKVAKPADPTKKGYKFLEWQLDGKAFSFEEAVTTDITLKATWERDETVWDGKEVDSSWYDETKPEFTIKKASELAGLAQLVNKGTRFEGKTITLENDLDLGNYDWTPIGNVVSYPGQTFAGTFKGNNKVISNMKAVSKTKDHATAGLFGSITGKVHDLTLKDIAVESYHYAGGIVGYSSANTGMEIKNCHIDGGSITSIPELLDSGKYDNGDKAGGIIGYMVDGDLVEGCTVKNITVKAYRDIGGIIGCGAGTVKNNKFLDNVKLIQDNTNGYKPTRPDTIDSIVGRKESTIKLEANTGTATIEFVPAK